MPQNFTLGNALTGVNRKFWRVCAGNCGGGDRSERLRLRRERKARPRLRGCAGAGRGGPGADAGRGGEMAMGPTI